MILLSHPTANQNVRQTALAFASAGWLEEFWTCVHWQQGGLLDRAGERKDQRPRRPLDYRAVVHRTADEVLHLGELSGGGIDIVLAQHEGADRGRADETGDVGRDPAPFR